LNDLQRAYDDEQIFGKRGGEDLFQYIDFSIHESRFFEGGTDSSLLAEARAYWQRSLDGCLDKHLSLCQNPPRMNIDDGHGNYLFDLEMDLVADFVSLAAIHNLSLYQMHLATYVLFLYKMTGDRDICVGGVTANRYRSEQNDLIGMFVNLLPYRIKFDNNDDNLRAYYDHVRQVCLDFMRYGLLPLQEIVKLHRTSHDQLDVSPFFQTTLAFYSNTVASYLGTYSFDGVPCESISLPVSVVKFDLCLVVNHTLTDDDKGNSGRGRHRMLCKWEYSTRLYDVNEIQILATRFTSFLTSLIDAEKMTQLSVLIPNDFKVFRQLNDTQIDLSHSTNDSSIINHFEMYVHHQPDKVALIYNGTRFTYDQIDKQAIQLAAHLIESCGVRRGDVIMQCVNRGIEMVVGILAILKAQAIYCPLNPADPSHRLFSLIDDINASVVLCDRTTKAAFQTITANVEYKHSSLILVNMTEVLHSTTSTMRILQRQQSVTMADDIAYIVYTSGSTGQPKAVPISHENFMTCIRGMQHLKMINSSDIVAQITECTYDVHLMELLGCLVTGGTLVMLKQYGNMDMSYLANTIKNYNVTWAILVPTLALSLYEQLSTSVEHRDKLQSLKTWVSGGKKISVTNFDSTL
jgi:non-ribosomal peptide synthetase component F